MQRHAGSGAPGRGAIAAYAIGSIGTGGFSTLPGLVLVYYLTDTLGVAALAAGLLVTAAKVWDVLIDPVIGAFSDRRLAARGTRRGSMLAGALAIPACFTLTFAVPSGLDPWIAGAWVMAAFLASATAFSLFQVPYIALPAEIAAGYDDRTRLLTWRVVVLTFAILLFGGGGPMLRGAFDDPYTGYLVMALVAGLTIGAGMLASLGVVPVDRPAAAAATAAELPAAATLSTGAASFAAGSAGTATFPVIGAAVAAGPRAATPLARRSPLQSYRDGVAVWRRSQPFRALLGTFMLQGLATGLMLAGAQYVATWVLRSEAAVTLLFLALIAPALLLAPAWGALARRIGKERGFVLASALFTLAALATAGLAWAPGAWIYVAVAVAGAAYAGMQALPMAMLPDVIAHDARASGNGHAGTFGGVWTAGETTGMALGAALLTIVLGASGYVESVGRVKVEQAPAAILGIVAGFSIVPAAIMLLSLATLARYRLRKEDLDGP